MSVRARVVATVAFVSTWAGLALGLFIGETDARHDPPARPAPPAVTRSCDQGYILWQTPTGGITSQPNPHACPTETRP